MSSRKISMNVPENTDRQVANLQKVFGGASATDVYVRAVDLLARLVELGIHQDGVPLRDGQAAENVRIFVP